MRHEQAAALVAERVQEQLTASVAAEVDAHVATCGECRDLALTYRAVRAGARPRAAAGAAHPASAALVDFALAGDGLGEAEASAIRLHVTGCASCAAELAATRSAAAEDEDATGAAAGAPRPAAPAWLAIAAAVVAAILAYPAWLGLVRLPEQERAREALAARLAATSGEAARLEGPLAVHVLEETTRGAGGAGALTISAPPGPALVLLGVPLPPPPLPGAGSAPRAYRFELRSGTGAAIRAWELPAEEVAAQVRATGIVVLAVAAASLPAGDAELRVSLLPDTAPLLALPFRVARDAPAR